MTLLHGTRKVTGIAGGIDDEGCLLIRGDNGRPQRFAGNGKPRANPELTPENWDPINLLSARPTRYIHGPVRRFDFCSHTYNAPRSRNA